MALRIHTYTGLLYQELVRNEAPGDVFREPDVLLLRDRSDQRRQDRFWLGADLVVEVVGPDDPDRDLVEKRADYAAAGITVYLALVAARVPPTNCAASTGPMWSSRPSTAKANAVTSPWKHPSRSTAGTPRAHGRSATPDCSPSSRSGSDRSPERSNRDGVVAHLYRLEGSTLVSLQLFQIQPDRFGH